MNYITASIVIYNTNHELLDKLFTSISNSNICKICYVIDNYSVQSKYDFKKFNFIKYIKSPINLGYGAGHNIAIREALKFSTYHFVINPDISFDNLAMIRMIAKMDSDLNIGQLMPRVVCPNGKLQFLCKLIPTPVDLIFRRFLIGPFKIFGLKRNHNYELRFTGYKNEMNVPYLSGCFMLFRVSALKEIGLFDERFFMYPEDIDITRRMHEKFKTLFFPFATVVHEHAKESYKSKKLLLIHAINIIRYFNKWGWFFDSKRVEINKTVMQSLISIDRLESGDYK